MKKDKCQINAFFNFSSNTFRNINHLNNVTFILTFWRSTYKMCSKMSNGYKGILCYLYKFRNPHFPHFSNNYALHSKLYQNCVFLWPVTCSTVVFTLLRLFMSQVHYLMKSRMAPTESQLSKNEKICQSCHVIVASSLGCHAADFS